MKCISCCLERNLEVCRDCYADKNIMIKQMFKKQVFNKYGRRCFKCKKSDRQLRKLKPANPLTIHHLNSLGERFDIDNARPLCRDCHNLVELGKTHI